MKRAGRLTTRIVGAVMAVSVLGTGSVIIANTAMATQAMVPTTWVNMRSGPGTSHGVVTVLSPKETVQASGTITNGWYHVTNAKGQAGWVYKSYLRPADGGTPPPPPPGDTPPATGQATTTAAVNVRSGPGTSHAVVGVAAKGTTVPTTGKTSGGWTQVIWKGTARWISSNYLTSGGEREAPPPAVTGRVRTTANLYLRTGGSLSHPYTGVLPAHSVVDTTGRTTPDYTEIVYKGAQRWIASRFTKPVSDAPTPPPAPSPSGTVYVTVNALNVRATSAANGTIVGVVYRGAELKTTGVKENSRLQVIHKGVARWVYEPYTSTTPPGTPPKTDVDLQGYDRLNANGKAVVQHVLASYPRIRAIYGWRSSSNYSGDHPNGRAVDIMIPKWSSQENIDYGWAIARDFQANAKKYNVTYIIWRQQIWNASYPNRGWRWMEDRGGHTANHYDHVHVSVRD